MEWPWMILIGVCLVPAVMDESTDSQLQDQSVYQNHTVTFTFCTPVSQTHYTINGLTSNKLEETFRNQIRFSSTISPGCQCNVLTFSAWIEYDDALIEFTQGDESVANATLHIQGVSDPPLNLRIVEENCTHLTLKWDDPPSLFDDENTTYLLVFIFTNGTDTTMELNVTSSSYTVQKFANLTAVNVTAWNPVGEGGKSTLDLSKHIDPAGGTRDCHRSQSDGGPESKDPQSDGGPESDDTQSDGGWSAGQVAGLVVGLVTGLTVVLVGIIVGVGLVIKKLCRSAHAQQDSEVAHVVEGAYRVAIGQSESREGQDHGSSGGSQNMPSDSTQDNDGFSTSSHQDSQRGGSQVVDGRHILPRTAPRSNQRRDTEKPPTVKVQCHISTYQSTVSNQGPNDIITCGAAVERECDPATSEDSERHDTGLTVVGRAAHFISRRQMKTSSVCLNDAFRDPGQAVVHETSEEPEQGNNLQITQHSVVAT